MKRHLPETGKIVLETLKILLCCDASDLEFLLLNI